MEVLAVCLYHKEKLILEDLLPRLSETVFGVRGAPKRKEQGGGGGGRTAYTRRLQTGQGKRRAGRGGSEAARKFEKLLARRRVGEPHRSESLNRSLLQVLSVEAGPEFRPGRHGTGWPARPARHFRSPG